MVAGLAHDQHPIEEPVSEHFSKRGHEGELLSVGFVGVFEFALTLYRYLSSLTFSRISKWKVINPT